MEKHLTKVLLLDADGTQALPIAESLNDYNCEVYVACQRSLSYGFHTRYAKHRILTPAYSDAGFVDFFLSYIENERVEAIIPMTDEAACFLSKNKESLKSKVRFIIPDWDIFCKGYDKNSLMAICKKCGIPHPQTIDLQSEKNIPDSIFPALIKPNITTGGRGMTLVNSLEEFEKKYSTIYSKYGSCHLQQFIKQGGKQAKVQIFTDNDGNLKYSSVIDKLRYYPENGGSSCCNITVEDENMVKICYSVLKTIGWKGFADFDLIQDPDDGIFKIMEINPRLPACIKSAIKSGIDYGKIILDATLDRPFKEYHYHPGHQLRHIGFEMLWFYYSKNRFRTQPNWFHFWGRNLSYQDLSIKDPLPFVFGTLGNIKRILNPAFRESKDGLR